MPTVLVVGATRGLGAEIVKKYSSDSSNTVFGTTRSADTPSSPKADNIKWIPSIDVASPSAGKTLASTLSEEKAALDIVVITAGYFATESFDEPDWDKQVKMYTTSSIGPIFLVSALAASNLFSKTAKLILVSSESGSITLRHSSEGGGNFGHHASKAALNMVGKLLSFDLKEKGVAVGIVHPGFMRTEMTKGVGFDKFWDDGGAVTPEVAAGSLVEWIEGFGMEGSGTYWAPRGAGDIGTAEPVLGDKKDLPTPLQLPW
ncbi:NAD(P)-binding protein [Aulographum hederae CBS 113979]|uniref:NAD(P)-binding protein n=1 Tax=Aulographum hederae CBS 113979 TaxID=1176131 RepID=A0A6G1H329_9PEZI|nr:NAD(P)-binding protein [Aulographum hederae CBS 113979]